MGLDSSARPSSQSKKAGAATTTPPPTGTNPRTPTSKKRAGAEGEKKKKPGEEDRTQSHTPDAMRADLSTPNGAAAGLAESAGEAAAIVSDPDEMDAARSSFVQRDLTDEQRESLWRAPVDEIVVSGLVTSFLGLEDTDVDLLKSILLEYHARNIIFAKKQKFSAEQTAAFFSIMKAALERSIAKQLTLDGSQSLFRGYISKHSLSTEKSEGMFSSKQTRLIVEYATKTFFQHYNLFFFCFNQPQESQIAEIECAVEVPFPPPALSTGISEEKIRLRLEMERLQKEDAERLMQESLNSDPNKTSSDGALASLTEGLQTDRKSVANETKAEPAKPAPTPTAKEEKSKPKKK